MSKKKGMLLVTMLLSVCLLLSACGGKDKEQISESSDQKELTSGDYTYKILEDGSVAITRYSGKEEELTIPSELNGLKVTTIGENAFNYCKSLVSVSIPEGVVSVEDAAFFQCSNIKTVTIPSSLSHMGNNPFHFDDEIEQINISPNHSYLELVDGVLFSKPDKRLIYAPHRIHAYTIPQGTEIIGAHAFINCYWLNPVTIPDSVTEIGEGAFANCYDLSSVIIPNSVKTIGNGAFGYCSDLTYADIPDSVTQIGDNVFQVYSNDIVNGPMTVVNPNLVVKVSSGSYAEKYCQKNGIKITY